MSAGEILADYGVEVPEPSPVIVVPAYRTLADVDDTPPGPLLLGMYEPGSPNLISAPGGTGKGSTVAGQFGELLALGIRPMIFDAENRPQEWARRASGLGIDRSRIVYLQPKDLPRKLLGRPLWEIAPHLGRVATASGAGILFIDSILAAVGLGEDRLKSDAQAPYLFVASLDELGIPSVSLGHPPKGQPEGDPFGSVAWVNAMRLTWSGTRAEGDGHRVRWRPRKRNERGHIAGLLMTFSYGDDGRLSDVQRADDEENTREWLLAALVSRPRTVPDLAREWLDEQDEAPSVDEERRTEERISRAMRRMAKEGLVAKGGKEGRADQWSLPLS